MRVTEELLSAVNTEKNTRIFQETKLVRFECFLCSFSMKKLPAMQGEEAGLA